MFGVTIARRFRSCKIYSWKILNSAPARIKTLFPLTVIDKLPVHGIIRFKTEIRTFHSFYLPTKKEVYYNFPITLFPC